MGNYLSAMGNRQWRSLVMSFESAHTCCLQTACYIQRHWYIGPACAGLVRKVIGTLAFAHLHIIHCAYKYSSRFP
jgi:hypothetical protein